MEKEYKQYEYLKCGIIPCLKDEFVDEKFYRWYKLNNINRCYFEEVELR